MNAKEDMVFDLEIARRSASLQAWAKDCRERMARKRWKDIKFDSNHWPLKSRYGTELVDVNFEATGAKFEDKDPAYGLALRCLMAEVALTGEVKDPWYPMNAWRLLSRLDVPLHQLRRTDFVGLEKAIVDQAKASPVSAGKLYGQLLSLRAQLDLVSAKGGTERLAWSPAPQTTTALLALERRSRANFKAAKASILDRQIEALSDAHTAMFRGDERLSAYDRVTLAVMGLNMCCPNRVNEPLCMAVDDRFTLEEYLTRETEPDGGAGDPTLARVHQMLLVKGSKGAAWGAKPILNFMIAFADLCIEVIKRHGERSRKLVSWYEQHPDTLFLPTELEHLRGTDIDHPSLWKIMSLESREPTNSETANVKVVWNELHSKHLVKQIANPKALMSDGRRNGRKAVQVVNWSDLEPILLARVKQAMQDARRVTPLNQYKGRLSNMLMLFDSAQSPYLPSAIKYGSLKLRLRQSANAKQRHNNERYKSRMEPTLFEKLGLKMVVSGVVETAYIGTHDPRRWLTTQALDSGLPDVLANKWANRLDIRQLDAYNIRSAERRAQQAAMPAIKELEDMTAGLQKLNDLEAEYGLATEIVIVGDANIAMTSMDEIMRATEVKPVARTGSQIIVLYPQKYGACLQQHHTQPCRAYTCGPCNNNVVVKGHLPTNERVIRDSERSFKSIVNQLEALLIARQRKVADNPETLDEHILTLVREGLNPEAMARELLAHFHEINDQIKDRAFANKLLEALALDGYAKRLKDPDVLSGALIKFHNPSFHAAPGHERALEEVHGGRASVQARIEAFDQKYPQFAPKALALRDQRELLESDEDESEEDESQEAVNE